MQNLSWANFPARLACLAAILTLFAATRAMSAGTNDALLDLLLKKGIISSDEATQVQAEASAENSNNAAMTSAPSKWKISEGLKSVELFGDLRLRYEDRSARAAAGDIIDLQRFRYAFRVGLRGEALDDFYYGFRMDTSANPRSPFVTLGTSSTTSPFQGPFGKSSSGIDVGQIYIGWQPENWVNVTLGQMPNPLYTTPMVWSANLSPVGAAERFKYTVGQADFFATFGQFLYEDPNPTEADPGLISGLFGSGQNSTHPFLLAWQIGTTFHIDKDLSFKVAPTLYNYTGVGVSTTNGTGVSSPGYAGIYTGEGISGGVNNTPGNLGWSGFSSGLADGFAQNQSGINDLLILDIPGQVDFKINHLNARVFGDFAENLDGPARAAAAAAQVQANVVNGTVPLGGVNPIPVHANQVKAYQVGFAIGNKDDLGLVYGSTSRKHAWEARTYWQHIEQYALDPNLLDSDFFEGRENMQGIYAALAYGLSDNVIGTVRYGHASRIDKSLGTGGSNQDIPQMNPIQDYEIFQIDLTLRF